MTQSSVIEAWLTACLERPVSLVRARRLDGGGGCLVADCDFDDGTGVLKIYQRGFDDYSKLGPVATARKHLLALLELPEHGVRTPRVLGAAVKGNEAAILVERLEPLAPSPQMDRAAAENLARLHTVQIAVLGPELTSLIVRSKTNRQRIMGGILEMSETLDTDIPDWRRGNQDLLGRIDTLINSGEPECERPTLIHGDYFPVNFGRNSRGTIVVIDWDLLSMGDPMWDVAFLIGADPATRSSRRREAIEAAYRGPLDAGRLEWHVASWNAFWELRRLLTGSHVTVGKS